MIPKRTQTYDELLTKELAHYYANPLGFVMMAYPWGRPGTELENEAGPDENQKRFLIDLGNEVASRGFQRDRSSIANPHDRDLWSRHGEKRHGRLDRKLDS